MGGKEFMSVKVKKKTQRLPNKGKQTVMLNFSTSFSNDIIPPRLMPMF